jgi:4-amino-4-deoxy-L-arabinose transferase-like glycosyltransferase
MDRQLILPILLLALVVRLYHIDFPVAGWHSWRQADTAAMARNFYENGFDFLHPQIDWGGNSSGVVESEFPAYPFLVSLVYTVFGMNDTWGRVLSVIFSLATIYGLYLLVRKYVSNNVALWSAFIYAIIPLSIYYSRAFMPESAMLMCSVLGIYWFSHWLDKGSVGHFLLSCLAISLAVLLKIPTLYLGLPLFYLAWLRFGKSTFRTSMLWLYAFLVLLPVALWYYHAHQLFLQSGLTYGIWGFGTDKWGNFDIILTLKFYNDIFFKSIAERHLTYAGFIPFLIGLFIKRTTKVERLFDFWLIAVVIYFLIVAKGNQVHEYYQLPFILPAVVYVGKAFAKHLPLDSLRTTFASKPLLSIFFSLCIVGVVVLSYLRYDRFMNSETFDSSLFRLAAAAQEVTQRNELVIAVSEYNPIVLYRCNRKGWNSSVDQLDSTFIDVRRTKGARYVIGEIPLFDTAEREKRLYWLFDNYKVVAKGKDYFVIAL